MEKLKAEDGHHVDSELERIVDNALHRANLQHYAHPSIPGSDFKADFKVEDIFIEVWGMKNEKYEERSKRKIEYYTAKANFKKRLVQIEAIA